MQGGERTEPIRPALLHGSGLPIAHRPPNIEGASACANPFLLLPQGTFAGRPQSTVRDVGGTIDFLPQSRDAFGGFPQ